MQEQGFEMQHYCRQNYIEQKGETETEVSLSNMRESGKYITVCL